MYLVAAAIAATIATIPHPYSIGKFTPRILFGAHARLQSRKLFTNKK
jgi:hypothetical protein